MPMPTGHLLALDAADVKALRAVKGDPKRRTHVKGLLVKTAPPALLGLGDCWQYLEFLSGKSLFTKGKSLHKGELCHLVLLDLADLSATVAALPQDEAGTARAFLAIDEAAFAYRYVPFWVKNEWTRDGVKTALTAQQAAKAATALTALRVFMDHALGKGLTPLFFCDSHL